MALFPSQKFNFSGLSKRVPLLIAVVSGICAVVLINSYIQQNEDKLKNSVREEYVNVVVAVSDIKAGSVIDEKSLGMKKVAKSGIEPNAVGSAGYAVGKTAAVDISKGEQILASKLKIAGSDTSLAMKTPAGKRAISIVMDTTSAVGGMIKAGDYVDVIGNIPIPKEVDGKQQVQVGTLPIFQNVLVLAVSGKGQGDVNNNPTVTLALNSEEATLLSFVQEQGKVRLILRSPADSQVKKVMPATWDTVFQYVYPELVEQQRLKEAEGSIPPAPKKSVEVYRGFKKEVVYLEE